MLDHTKVVSQIIKREGGFVNHPSDKGGPTNMGITQVTLAAARGRPVSVQEVQQLTEAEATRVYVDRYVTPLVPYANTQQLLDLLVDSAVLHGVSRVLGWIQDIALFSTDTNVLYKGILKRRYQLIADIVVNNPNQIVFLKGWINRLSEFIR
jgi:lysozyme family protein